MCGCWRTTPTACSRSTEKGPCTTDKPLRRPGAMAKGRLEGWLPLFWKEERKKVSIWLLRLQFLPRPSKVGRVFPFCCWRNWGPERLAYRGSHTCEPKSQSGSFLLIPSAILAPACYAGFPVLWLFRTSGKAGRWKDLASLPISIDTSSPLVCMCVYMHISTYFLKYRMKLDRSYANWFFENVHFLHEMCNCWKSIQIEGWVWVCLANSAIHDLLGDMKCEV